MKKAPIRGLLSVLIIFAVILMQSAVCLADGQGIILSKSKSVTNGSTFNIDIVAKGSWPKLVCYGPITVKYDTSKLTYIESKMITGSGTFAPDEKNGVVTVLCYGGSAFSVADGTRLVSLSFKAKALGSCSLSFQGAEGFAAESNSEISVSTGSAISVTITAPVVKSDNNSLKSLDIDPGSLSPAFSADQTSYAASVDAGVSKLTVSAVAADSKAKVTVSGNTDLKDGDNTILVVVTAENGAKKTYTITATRAAPSPTPAPTPTPAVTIQLIDGPWSITDLPAEVPVPEGFYKTLISMSGQMVPVFKALKGDLTLYFLSNQAGESGFFYYDTVHSAYEPYSVLAIPAQSFSVLNLDEGVAVPAGFLETEIMVGGVAIKAWEPDPNGDQNTGENEYLLYLMTSQGDRGFFWFNSVTLMMAAYQAPKEPEATGASPTESAAATPAPQEEQKTARSLNPWQFVALLLGVLCLILLGLVIWLATSSRSGNRRAYRYSEAEGDDMAYLDDDSDDDHRPPSIKAPPIRRVN